MISNELCLRVRLLVDARRKVRKNAEYEERDYRYTI